jgi:hypothetical protein
MDRVDLEITRHLTRTLMCPLARYGLAGDMARSG